MTKLCILSEGTTEDNYVRRVLKPYLASLRIDVIHQIVDTGRRKKKSESGGGGFPHMQAHLRHWLADDRYASAKFTTMWDLYGLPIDFPRRDEILRVDDPYEKVERAEQALAEAIGDARLIPYLQLHEFETLLFCDPSKLLWHYVGHEDRVAELAKIAKGIGNPELIDDGYDTCPSRRIEAVFKKYPKAKTRVGPKTAEKIGLTVLRKKCRHFSEWVDRLETLGATAD